MDGIFQHRRRHVFKNNRNIQNNCAKANMTSDAYGENSVVSVQRKRKTKMTGIAVCSQRRDKIGAFLPAPISPAYASLRTIKIGVESRRIRKKRKYRECSLLVAQAHISHSQYDILDLYPAKKQSSTPSTPSPLPRQP